MAISFNQIPANIRVPGVYSEVDNSQAVSGPQLIQYKRLIIGQKLGSGSAPANTLVRATSTAEARDLFGIGSMLHGMAIATFKGNSFTETWFMPLDDNGAGNAATGNIVFGGPATAAGTVFAYFGGRLVQAGVTSGDTAADVVAALVAAAAALTLDEVLPVTLAINGGDPAQLDVTARHAGEDAGDIDIRIGYFDGQDLPEGITATVTAMSGGTGNPILTAAIAALGDEWFQVWANPYTDAVSLTAIEVELADRFGPLREIEGHCFSAKNDTLSGLGVLGESRNSPHSSIIMATDEPMPAYEKAAETAGIAAFYAAADPARPLQTLPYVHCLPAVRDDLFTLEERNILLFDGIGTTYVDAGNVMRTERLITTYQENAVGAPDVSYLDCETLFTLIFVRHDWRDYILRKYPRHKLADDGTRYGPGQAVVTPSVMRAEAVSKFREWEEIALVENIDQFKADLIVERNGSDANRLDVLLPPDLVNQLRIVANKIAFRL